MKVYTDVLTDTFGCSLHSGFKSDTWGYTHNTHKLSIIRRVLRSKLAITIYLKK